MNIPKEEIIRRIEWHAIASPLFGRLEFSERERLIRKADQISTSEKCDYFKILDHLTFLEGIKKGLPLN